MIGLAPFSFDASPNGKEEVLIFLVPLIAGHAAGARTYGTSRTNWEYPSTRLCVGRASVRPLPPVLNGFGLTPCAYR